MVKRILYVLSFCLLIACSETIEPSLKQDFFPISNNQFWEYEIIDIQYSLTQEPVIHNYFLKEKLTQLSESTYKIEHSSKLSLQEDWIVTEISSLQIEGNRIIHNKNGKPEILLYIPVSDGLSWNKNALNTSNEVILKTLNYGESFNSFSNTIQVIEKQDSSLINKDCIYSVYADAIGLVYQEDTDIEYCQSNNDCIGKGQIDSGRSFKKQLINSGIE